MVMDLDADVNLHTIHAMEDTMEIAILTDTL